MEIIEKFYAYLNDLLQNYTKLAALLKDKITAVDMFDIEKLDSIMKEEQVHVLLTKNFDLTVESYKQKLGIAGSTLSQIIAGLPEEERPRFESMLVDLKALLDEVKSLNHTCQERIEERLSAIDKALRQLDKSEAPTYGKSGEAAKDSGSMFFTKNV